MEWFRQAQWATKYMSPEMLVTFNNATAGTPLLPRDIATMMFAGRLFAFQMPDGRKVYSVQTLKDVSESLDVISQTPGNQLIRGPEYWEGVPQITGNRAGATVERAANQTTGGIGVFLFPDYTTEIRDQAFFWSSSAPKDIIIPITGWYSYRFQARRNNTGACSIEMGVQVNGAFVNYQSQTVAAGQGGGLRAMSGIFFANIGDVARFGIADSVATQVWNTFGLNIVGNA